MGLFLFLSACFSGKQTGQSLRVQCFQWLMIWREELQWATEQLLPAWHEVMWLRTFFMVLQWGRMHCHTSPFACDSLRWHLWACRRSTSCCWISLRFSGSAAKQNAWSDLVMEHKTSEVIYYVFAGIQTTVQFYEIQFCFCFQQRGRVKVVPRKILMNLEWSGKFPQLTE